MAEIQEAKAVGGDTDQEIYWSQLAQEHWGKAAKSKKVRSEVIEKEIWDVLSAEDFAFRSLHQLETLLLLENYLWPGFTDHATNHHVLLIALLVTIKTRENLPTWDLFDSNPARFASFFRRTLSMSLDSSIAITVRTHLLTFLLAAFQSLDNGLVRKECAPLVSISIWHNLCGEGARNRRFEENAQLRKAWRASTKRYEAGDEEVQAKLRFDRSWLYSLLLDFVGHLYADNTDDLTYCEKFIEFLTDLESQLPTRRYINALLQDMNILALIRLSPKFDNCNHNLLRDLFVLLRHYINFPIDNNTGVQSSRLTYYEQHHERLARLQRIALKHFQSKLSILALSNYGSIDRREDLMAQLRELTDAELKELCTMLDFRTMYPVAANIIVDRNLLLEILISRHERRKSFQDAIKDLNIQPTEAELYDPSFLRNESFNGSRSLAIPKLNLQYLSVGDFLWRSFILYRCEQFFEIRKFLEAIMKRLQPVGTDLNDVKFKGFSKLALPVTKPAILEAAPAKVGHEQPAFVRAEVTLNVSKLADSVRREWEALRPEEVVYLLAVRPMDGALKLTNGQSDSMTPQQVGMLSLRTAEVVQILDEQGRSIRDPKPEVMNGYGRRPHIRRLIVNVDPIAFKTDSASKETGKPDIYESVNVIVRRSQRENNWKKILESIQNLALSDVPLPYWLQEVFLGYGDPTSANHSRLSNRPKTVNLQDTFIDWQHLVDSFADQVIEPANDEVKSSGPPYLMESSSAPATPTQRSSKKRRRNDDEPAQQSVKASKISTYRLPPSGPYPIDVPKQNNIRFTPSQVEAITSGTQQGLTVIVGPPGTGKTDVATQIINNIYHNSPSQRTLLITHSNQALNQLFQKIMKLDVDGRHLLRLGQGEGELETAESYSKFGRVESFLDSRAYLLAEVDRLAANFGAPGAHGSSCETADYFNSVYIQPAWAKFWDLANRPETSQSDIISAFPYHDYFQNAPQPLLPHDASKESILEIIQGCERHVSKIFVSLEDIRPFEILRSNKDRTNFLMIKEARIIAMTTTHAAMRRLEIAELGFHYDNVILEEAAQITEIENFIPLAMQKTGKSKTPLERVILCGDHLQNSPVIQNMAFRQFAKLEQSLFLRLVRLGVPTINLDHQGRARPSIAELYKWRYPDLKNLANVLSEPEYLHANAGFKYDYQFIDVPDYKGCGESQPTSHFIQNLGEAEYAVAIYQYMRLLGYPASKISILTTYAGQRALIRDVLGHRCSGNRLFGLPRIVTTVDKYQGEQNDYIILSLTRTRQPGYLRDVRRLTVALSRARLGLYILGRRAVFQSSPELLRAFALPLERPEKLMLTPGEMFPTSRLLDDKVDETEMVGVEHLGQYVFEMTQAKVNMLKNGQTNLPPPDIKQEFMEDDEEAADGPEANFAAEDIKEELDDISWSNHTKVAGAF